jgi:hypothetical protein
MKRLNILLSILIMLGAAFSSGAAHPTQQEDNLWQELSPGIAYRRFFLPGPNLVYVTRLDRSAAAATIESSLGQGRLNAGAETVREQALRYQDTLSNWGEPGLRMKVVASINGSYFDTLTGISNNGQVQGGWYIHRFEDRQNSSGFAWTADRQAFIGACVTHRPGKQVVRFAGLGSLPFEGINVPPGEDGLVIYTPQFDAFTPGLQTVASTPAPKRILEIVVQLEQPLWILPEPDGVSGTVTAIFANQGQTPIAFDQVVLSARGESAKSLEDQVKVGDKLQISQEIRHLTSNCKTDRPESWTKTYASVSGSYILLENGQVQPQDNLGAIVRNPRTAVALNQEYIYFIVVDGRDRLRSLGMSMVELAGFAQIRLGASDAIAQDGGGSSTMVINGQVVNHPNAELVDQMQSASPTPTASTQPRIIERAVANGLMMVALEKAQFSYSFKAGDIVTIQADGPVNLRAGPGVNYGVLNAVTPGSPVAIQAHPLTGVFATGYYWYLVQSGEQVGWMIEDALKPK